MRNALKELLLDAQDILGQGETGLAIKTYKAALEVATKGQFEEYLVLTYLGMAYDDADDELMATEYFKKCQQLAVKLFGEDSQVYPMAIANEGTTICNRGRLTEAEPILDKAVAILRAAKRRKQKDRDVIEFTTNGAVEIYANAADCKAKLGKDSEAIELMQVSYTTARSTLGIANPRTVQAAIELAMFLDYAGQNEESDGIMHEIKDILEKHVSNPVAAMAIFSQAAVKAGAMVDGIEHHRGRNQTKKPAGGKREEDRRGSVVSNVVPLFSAEGTPADVSSREIPGEKQNCRGYQIKIALKRVKPPVWRRVSVPADFSLREMHDLIQTTMGWYDEHLHEFRIGRNTFGDPKMTQNVKNEKNFALIDFDFQVGSKFEYEYDFGDGWIHSIEIERLLNDDEFKATDAFIAAKGACPPEDCGGPYGFMHLLAALKDSPRGRKHLPEWLQDYDPDELPPMFPRKKKSKSSKSRKAGTLKMQLLEIEESASAQLVE